MKKYFLFLLVSVIGMSYSFGQNYGNEWVDYDETYYKFMVDEDGMYRIGYETLLSSGITLIGTNFALIARGEEVPIYVTTNGAFGPGDYIEFYGKENDGFFDTPLYEDPDFQLYDEASILTDKIFYFLISDGSTTHERVETISNDLTNLPAAEEYFLKNELKINQNTHHGGETSKAVDVPINFAYFVNGEGWTSTSCNGTVDLNQFLSISEIHDNGPQTATVVCKVVGKNDDNGAVYDQHVIVEFDGVEYVNEFQRGFDQEIYEFEVPLSSLGDPFSIVKFKAQDGVDFVGGVPFNYETKYAVAYQGIEYPRDFKFNNERTYDFDLQITSTKYLEIEDFDGGNTAILYDKTGDRRIVAQKDGNTYKIKLPIDVSIGTDRSFHFFNSTSSLAVTSITELEEREFIDYTATSQQGEYVILTNNKLRTGGVDYVEEYRKYRQTGETTLGGHSSPINTYDVAVIDVDQLYDQYAFGIPTHPLAIKNFFKSIIDPSTPGIPSPSDEWNTQPEYLLLLGESKYYKDYRFLQANFDECMVPTFGWEGADNLLTATELISLKPELITGRVPVINGDQIDIYLDKVIEYEQAWVDGQSCELEDRRWLKNALYVTHAWSNDELEDQLDYSEASQEITTSGSLGINVLDNVQDVCYKCGNNAPGEVYDEYIDEGINLVVYNGHSVPKNWQFAAANFENEFWNNEGQYPFIYSNTCFSGNVHLDTEGGQGTYADRLIMEDGLGAIGFLGTLSFSYPAYLNIFSDEFLMNLSETHYNDPIAKSIYETTHTIANNGSLNNQTAIIVTLLEFTYIGDPAIELYNWDDPELVLFEEGNSSGLELSQTTVNASTDDEILLTVNVENWGMNLEDNVRIKVEKQYENNAAVEVSNSLYPISGFSTQLIIPVAIGTNDQNGNYTLIVTVDPNNSIPEDCDDNDNNESEIGYTVGGSTNECSEANFLNVNEAYCQNAPSFNILTDINGTVFINDIETDVLNPGSLGAGDYIIELEYSSNGVADCSETIAVEIFDAPEINFSVPASSVCENTAMIMEYFVAGANSDDIVWDFDGATSSIGTLPNTYVVNFPNPGTYVITGTIENAGGCSNSYQESVQVSALPMQPVLDCVESTQNSITIEWDSIEGVFYYELQVNGVSTFLPSTSTSYIITGLEPFSTHQIQIAGFSEACNSTGDYSVLQNCNTGDCVPETINFTNVSNGDTFCSSDDAIQINVSPMNGTFQGIGVTANGQFNPALGMLGSNMLTYNYVDTEGCPSSGQVTLNVVAAQNIDINGMNSICDGESGVQYNAIGSFASYQWNVDGGTINSGGGLNDNFVVIDWNVDENGGVVEVVGTDSNSCTAAQTFDVTVDQATLPVSNFTLLTSIICEGSSTTIQNNSVNAESYEWTIVNVDTGEEFTSFNDNPNVPIESAGEYAISLTAYGCGNSQDDFTASTNVSVTAAPLLELESDILQICVGDTINLSAIVEVNGEFEWSGSNIITDNGNVAQAIPFDQESTYSVEFVDENNCSSTAFVNIVLAEDDVSVDFTSNVLEGCPGTEFIFENLSENGTEYTWSIGNQSTQNVIESSEINPIFVLQETGLYDVQLSAKGCNEDHQILEQNYLQIYPFPDVDVRADEEVVCPGEEVILSATAGEGTTHSWSGPGLTLDAGNEVTALITADTTVFEIISVNEFGCEMISTLTVLSDEDECNVEEIIPNVITPNGDNANDTWVIEFLDDYPNHIVEIYSRWGAKLFDAAPYDHSFNGEVKGDELPVGTYYYIIYLNDGITEPMSGTLNIIK